MIQKIIQIALILLVIAYIIWWISHGGINISNYSKKYLSQPFKTLLWKESSDASSTPNFIKGIMRITPQGQDITPYTDQIQDLSTSSIDEGPQKSYEVQVYLPPYRESTTTGY